MSVVLRNDSDTAVLDVERGYSRALAYLVKHQRLSLGAMHEDLILDANNALVRCNTKRMPAARPRAALDAPRDDGHVAAIGEAAWNLGDRDPKTLNIFGDWDPALRCWLPRAVGPYWGGIWVVRWFPELWGRTGAAGSSSSSSVSWRDAILVHDVIFC